MKKSKNVLINLLIIVFAVICSFSVFACGDAPAGSSDNQAYSTACKKAAAAIGETLTDKKQEGAKGFSFVETSSIIESQTAFTLIYYIGLLYEDEGFDITENPAYFGGKYDYDFNNSGNTMVYEIYLTAYAVFDKENSKFALYFSQETQSSGFDVESNVFLDIVYDFDTKTVGDIYLYVGMDGNVVCCAKISGGKSYSLNLSEQDETYQTYINNYNEIDTNFTALKVNTVNLTQDLRSKYVQAQLYEDSLVGQTSGIKIHND